MSVPKSIKLNSGLSIPTVGFGTWKSPPGKVTEAVVTALECGYRHIDCAFIYQNEGEIGDGLSACIKKGIVRREDVFVTSKVWNTFHRRDLVRHCVEQSLKLLQTDYLDLVLMHWPMAYKAGAELFPKDENDKFIYADVDYLDCWKGMEDLAKEGLIKSIGLSNFNSKQIQRVLDNCEIKPAMVQAEIHAHFPNRKLVDFCHSHGIAVTAYSPLGSPARPWVKPEDPILLEHPKLSEMAERLHKTNAQILLRWLMQRNCIVIPKSVTSERIKSNFQVFDFKLSDAEMSIVDSLDINHRTCCLPWVNDHPFYPFHEEF